MRLGKLQQLRSIKTTIRRGSGQKSGFEALAVSSAKSTIIIKLLFGDAWCFAAILLQPKQECSGSVGGWVPVQA